MAGLRVRGPETGPGVDEVAGPHWPAPGSRGLRALLSRPDTLRSCTRLCRAGLLTAPDGSVRTPVPLPPDLSSPAGCLVFLWLGPLTCAWESERTLLTLVSEFQPQELRLYGQLVTFMECIHFKSPRQFVSAYFLTKAVLKLC